ncbi:MAG: hypothetical protein V2I46_06800, partial [Bacteroides sp.]|nr:hypothetical protein [Bacteroides sp.]
MKKLLFVCLIAILASINVFAANYYWVGGSGNWSDFQNHWATTSGGTVFHTQAPTQFDQVIFDGNSFPEAGAIVTIDQVAVCLAMEWTGVQNLPTLAGAYTQSLNVYGSFTLTEGMDFQFSGDVYFMSEEEGRTITMAGHTFKRHIFFQGAGSYTLQDDLSINGAYNVHLYQGGLDLNNHDLTASRFIADNTTVRTLTLGTSTITLSYSSSSSYTYYAFLVNGTNLTFSGEASTIRLTGYRAYFANVGVGLTFNDVFFESSSGSGLLNGSNSTFSNVVFNAPGSLSGTANSVDNLTFMSNGSIGSSNNNINILSFGGTATLGGNTGTYNQVTMPENSSITGDNNTFGTLTFAAGKQYTLTAGRTQFILNDLIAAGTCAEPIIIQSNSTTTQSTLSKASGTITLERVNLQGLNATGGATFIANDAIDLGNNTGWVINLPATQNLYWVGGTGNWEDISHWASESGGQGGFCVPTKFDNVIFDHNSFDAPGQTVTILGDASETAYCQDMIWTGVLNAPSLYAANTKKLKMHGSLTLSADMVFNLLGDIFFESEAPLNTITSASQSFKRNVYFQGTGTYQLSDAFSISGNFYLYLDRGGLDLNDQTVNLYRFFSTTTNERSLDLGASTVTLSYSSSTSYTYYALDFNGTNLILNSGTSLIRYTGARPYLRNNGTGLVFHNVLSEATTGEFRIYASGTTFNQVTTNNSARLSGGNTIAQMTVEGNSYISSNNNNIAILNVAGEASFSNDNSTYGLVSIQGNATLNGNNSWNQLTLNGNGTITGNNTFSTLTLTAGNQYTLTYNKTQTITGDLLAEGSCAGPIVIQSSSTTSQTTLSKASGTVTLNFVSLQGLNAIGGASFIANEATDLGNNTGWVINLPAPKTLYWVGGTGNWEDISHWSGESGGEGGYCVPSRFDNVIFDQNSFDAPGQIVTINGDASENAFCQDMTWTGVLNAPTLYAATSKKLNLHGSLTLSPDMSFNFLGDIFFVSEIPLNSITSAGQTFKRNVYFQGTGTYQLADAFEITGNFILYLDRGGLDLNDQTVSLYRFFSTTTNERSLDLGASTVTLSYSSSYSYTYYALDFNGTNLTLDSGTSLIRYTGARPYLRNNGTGLVFHNVLSEATTGETKIYGSASTFNHVTTNNSVSLYGGNTIAQVIIGGNSYIVGSSNNMAVIEVAGNATFGNDNGTYGQVTIHGDATLGGNNNYGQVTLNGNGTITGNNTFGTLTFSPGKQYTLTYNKTQTITNDLVAQGTCGDPIIIQSSSTTSQAIFSKASGTITLERVNLQGLNATGGASFIANDAIDLGNNTGWVINLPGIQNLYWVGGTGNWEDISHWASTSGGEGGYCVPTRFDHVIFDENSFDAPGQTVTINGDASANAYCLSMNWTGVTNSPILTGPTSTILTLYGSLTLADAMNYNFLGDVYFESAEPLSTITSAGQTFKRNLYFQGTGLYVLQDALAMSGAYILYLNKGGLDFNNQDVTLGRLLAENTSTRTLLMDASTLTLTYSSSYYYTYYAFSVNGTNLTFDATNALIRFTGGRPYFRNTGTALNFHDLVSEATSGGASVSAPGSSFHTLTFYNPASVSGGITAQKIDFYSNGSISSNNNDIDTLLVNGTASFGGDNGTFGHVTLNGSGGITGNNTFGTLILTSGNQYTLASGRTQTILGDLRTEGPCAMPITLWSNSTTTQTTISKVSGTVTVSRMDLRGINATGGATFIANNSMDSGNNTGWTLTEEPQNLYWVGGSGNWNDVSHWSAESGGEGGFCMPTRLDHAIFDENSFSQTGQTVTINITNAECKDMSWTDVTYQPILNTTSGSNNLRIFGSLSLNANMDFAFSGKVYFEGLTPAEGTYTIATAGRIFNNDVYFNGVGGVWTLVDPLDIATNDLYLNFGTLNTNGKPVSLRRFISDNNNLRGLQLGASVITIGSTSSQAWYVNGNNFSLAAGTSEIILTPAITGFWSTATGDITYNKVVVLTAVGSSTLRSNNNFNEVILNPDASLLGGGHFQKILFNANASIDNNNTFGEATFMGNAVIKGNNSFQRLVMTPGKDYQIQAGSTQTLGDDLVFWGHAEQPIQIHSLTEGSQATFSKTEGEVNGNYILLKDMNATGGATFNVYNSQDLGNNTGWNFMEEPGIFCPADQQVCINIPPFVLPAALPEGGTYSGNGVYLDADTQAYMFDPQQAGAGQAVVTYHMVVVGLFPKECSFVIDVLPLPEVNCPDDITVCAGSEYIELTGGTGIYTLEGEPITGFNPVTPGDYLVTYTETNDCGTSFCLFTIQVLPLPEASISGLTEFCENGETVLTASAATAWLWNTGETTQSITVSESGGYTVTVTGENTCTAVASVTITEHPLPEMICQADMGIWCNDDPVLLTGSLPAGGVYAGEGVEYNGTEDAWYFIPSCEALGEFTVTYTFTSEHGCVSSCSFVITVSCPPSLIVTPTFDPVEAICAGGVLEALPTLSTNGITGTWTPALNNLETTTYTFTPDENQCAESTTLTITVNPILSPEFDPVEAICAGGFLDELPTLSNNGISGSWSPALNNMETTTYTFTPDEGQCAESTTLTI